MCSDDMEVQAKEILVDVASIAAASRGHLRVEVKVDQENLSIRAVPMKGCLKPSSLVSLSSLERSDDPTAKIVGLIPKVSD